MKEKFIQVNSQNLLFNYNYYAQKTNKQIIAIIKDNAYGHGIQQTIEVLDNTNIKIYLYPRQ